MDSLREQVALPVLSCNVRACLGLSFHLGGFVLGPHPFFLRFLTSNQSPPPGRRRQRRRRHLALAFRAAVASSLSLLRRHRALTYPACSLHKTLAVVLVELGPHAIGLPNLLHTDLQPQVPPASDRCDEDIVVDLRCY